MKFIKKEKGSILLETAIIFPVFIIFIFFLWTLIRISVMQMALDKATSEVAQTMSRYSYYGSISKPKIKKYFIESINFKSDDIFGMVDIYLLKNKQVE